MTTKLIAASANHSGAGGQNHPNLLGLIDAYAEARHVGGCHTYNAKTADARAKVVASLQSPGFTAADMATASAQGFMDGVASIAASAGSEPVAWRYVDARGHFRYVGYKPSRDMAAEYPLLKPIRLYLHPSPPGGMVGGWMPIETAPKGELVLLWSSVKRGEPFIGDWADYMRCNQPQFTHWSRWIPTPPTTSADSRKGE